MSIQLASPDGGVSFSGRLLGIEVPCYGERPWIPRTRRLRLVRTAGLASRNLKDLAVKIIEAEIRSAQYEVLLEAAKLVQSGEPVEIARQPRDRAERTIRLRRSFP